MGSAVLSGLPRLASAMPANGVYHDVDTAVKAAL
jgi:hypothetical protein